MTALITGGFPRHSFIRVDVRGWSREWLTPTAEQHASLVSEWFKCDRPAVITRSQPELSGRVVGAGIALPPATGKLRIALAVPKSAICSAVLAPSLHEVAQRSRVYRAALLQLAARAAHRGLSIRVYGSFAWEHLTGLPFIGSTSDIDVLCEVREREDLETIPTMLSQWSRSSGLRVDGELLFPDGRAVSWLEWSSGRSDTVLVKRTNALELSTRTMCLRALAEPSQRVFA